MELIKNNPQLGVMASEPGTPWIRDHGQRLGRNHQAYWEIKIQLSCPEDTPF
jgi:hypothetical protein